MNERNSDGFPFSANEILDRIAEVSAMLHLEQGDRQQLQSERARLMEYARRTGILPSKQGKMGSDS